MTNWNTIDHLNPTRFVIVEDIGVFGLHLPLHWAAGTEVVSLTDDPTADPVPVAGPGGRTVRLPARLLRKVSNDR